MSIDWKLFTGVVLFLASVIFWQRSEIDQRRKTIASLLQTLQAADNATVGGATLPRFRVCKYIISDSYNCSMADNVYGPLTTSTADHPAAR